MVLGLALLLRLPHLSGSFWLDEAAQALESARPFSQQLQIKNDFQPPLLHLITHFALKLGSSEWWLRSIGALIPGLGSIYLTYLLAKHKLNRKTAILTSFLLAISSLHIFYSQELRPYSLPALWAAASWWAIVGSQHAWLAIFTALGLYSSYLYPFVILGQFVYLAFKFFNSKPKFFKNILDSDWAKHGLSISLGSLAFMPWLPYFFEQLSTGQALRLTLPDWSTAVSIPQLKALPLVLGKFLYGLVDLEINASFILTSLLWLGLLSALVWQNFIKKPTKSLSAQTKDNLLIVICWWLLPLLISWIISFVVPVVRPKRLLLLLPGFYLGLAWIITYQKSLLSKIFASLTIIIFLIGTANIYTNPNIQREDWRSLVAQVESTYPTNSALVVAYQDAYSPWRWYSQNIIPVYSLGKLSVTQVENLSEQLSPAWQYQTIITFDYLADLTDPDRQVQQSIKQAGYKPTDLLDFPQIGYTRIFEKSSR